MYKNVRKLSFVFLLIFLFQSIIMPNTITSIGKSGPAPDTLSTSSKNNKNAPSDITSIQTTGAGAEYTAEEGNLNFQTDRFIIKYKDDTGREKLYNKFIKKDFKRIGKIGKNQRLDVISFDQKKKLKDFKEEIKTQALDNEIEYVQPDYLMSFNSNDPLYGSQWGIQNNASDYESTTPATLTYVCDTGIADAWEKSTGEDVTVAVIDTGVDINHEDLKDNIWTNSDEIPNNGLDDDNNGYIDDVNGWNFAEQTNVVYNSANATTDTHGTHVAGIIAAVKDNEKGIAGAAPSAKIMPLKVFKGEQAYTSDIISAIEYAENMDVAIVNCSWGGTYENQALKEAMQNSDMLFTCAVGNSTADIDTIPIYPAAYDLDNIISVASVNQYGNLSSFSNYGESSTDVAAPGEGIMSTLPDNGYSLSSGTSMATAFVSAEAALLLSLNSGFGSNDLKTCIIDNSMKLDTLIGKVQDGNFINVPNAIENVKNITGTKESLVGKQIILTKAQKEYLDTINSIKRFAEANEKQRKIISNYLKIDFKLLLAAEKQGYSIKDSILVAKIIQNTNLKYPEIKEGLKNYTDLIAFYAASNQYSNLLKKWGYPQKILDELKQFFLKGKNMLDIERASIIAIIFDVSLNDVIAQDDEDNRQMDNYTKEEAKLLYSLVNENNISIKWLAQYLKDKGMSCEEFSKKVTEFYLTHLEVRETLQTKQVNNELTLFSNGQEEDKYKAPFSYEEYNQEKIERNTGSLIFENTDIFLPGKNGLDFKLISRYNSDEDHCEMEAKIKSGLVSVYDVDIETSAYQNGQLIYYVEHRTGISTGEFNRINEIYKDNNNVLIYRDGNTEYRSYITYWQECKRNEYNYTKASCCTPTYNQQDSPLGLGWGFVFDSIEFERNNLYKNSAGEWCKVLKKEEARYLHLSDGETYKINGDLTLEGYKLNDIKLKYDFSYNNGQKTSTFVLEYKDGIKKYFADDGRLLAIRDKYENTIKFQHTNIHEHPVITKIIDSLGREITINYDFTNLKVVVSTDNCSVTYNLIPSGFVVSDRESGQDKYLLYRVESRVDTCFRKTTYKYDQLISRDAFIGNSYITDNSNVLSKVIYPTGMKVQYTYNSAKRYTPMYTFSGTYLNEASMNNYYTPTSSSIECYPKVIKKTILDKNETVKNYVDYSYVGSYTGYPYDLCDNGMIWLSNIYYKSYKFIVANLQEQQGFYRNQSISKEYEFNFKHQLLAEKEYTINSYVVKNNMIIVNRYVLSNGIDYKYNTTDRQLIQKIAKTYTIPSFTTTDSILDNDQNLNKYVLKVEDFKYDSYGNLEKYWGPEAARNSDNQLTNPEYDLNRVAYSYDTGNPGKYNLLLCKEYWKDKDTKIVQTNILTSDRKGIYESNIQQNGVTKSKVRYNYDNWGNIVNEKIFTDEKTYNDEVALNRNYIEKAYSYMDNDGRVNPNGIYFNGSYLTSKSAIEVVNGSVIGEAIVEKYIYDYYGNVKNYTDPKEYETGYQYDLLGRLRLKTNLVDLTTVSYDYDDTNNILTVKDENNGEIVYEYDEYGNLRYEKDKITGKILKEYSYNEVFKLTCETNNTSCQNYYKIEYVYTYDGRVRSKTTTDKDGNIIAQEYYLYDATAVDIDGNGSIDSKTTKIVIGDSNSPSIVTTQYTDRNGFIKREGKIFKGEELYTTYNYDFIGNKTEGKSARANKENLNTTKYEYDYAGRLTKTIDMNGNISSITYDAAGRAIAKTDNRGNRASPIYSTLYQYDLMGRVVRESVPFEETFEVNGSIVRQTTINTIKEYNYDKNGNLTLEKVTNCKPGYLPTYRQTGYDYDNRNRLVKVIAYENSTETKTITFVDKGGNIVKRDMAVNVEVPVNYTQYFYDNVGNKLRMYTGLSSPLTISGLDSVTGQDRDYIITKYTYDRFNQLVSMTDNSGKTESYTYDLNGNMTSKTDRIGNVITMMYDGLNRILSKSVVTPDGNGNESYVYSYTLTGNKLSTAGPGITSTFLYDELGRLSTETQSDGIIKGYTYDADNNRKTFVLTKSGITVTNTSYDYDSLNRLWKVYDNGVLTATYGYDENGNRNMLTYNTTGISTEYKYNLANKLLSLTNKKGATILSSYAYTYYIDGNQASKTDNTGKVTSYAYDGQGRLTSESPQGEDVISYIYDDNNNRKTMTVGNTATAYEYDNNNRLTSETRINGDITEIIRYMYDNNGNQTYKGIETLKPSVAGEQEVITAVIMGENEDDCGITLSDYDGFNQLKKVTTGNTIAEYTYNPDGLRISKKVNGITTKHIWDGNQITLDLDGVGTVTGRYIRGINLIAAEDGTAVRKYYLFNGHGDVVQLTGVDGNVIKNYEYDAFGNEKIENSLNIAGTTFTSIGDGKFNTSSSHSSEYIIPFLQKDIGTFADVTGDGKADYIAVLNNNGRRYFTTYVAIGDGVFSTPINTASSGTFIADITGKDIGTFADVTGDGKVDYIVPWNGGYRYFTTYVSKGDGTFNEHITTPSLGGFISDTTGKDIGTFADVTGDGKADYIVPWNNGGIRYLATYVSKGDGTFNEHINTPNSGGFISDTTGRDIGTFADVTGDGKADYIVPWNNGGKRYLAALVSKGDGTFNAYINTASSGTFIADITGKDIGTFADVTGDGKADYIVPWNGGYRYFTTYVSKGDGTFNEHITTPSLGGFISDTTGKDIGTFADVTGDGKADYIVPWNSGGIRYLATYVSKGDGTFNEYIDTPNSGGFLSDTTGRDIGRFADVTGDGKVDYVIPWMIDTNPFRYCGEYFDKETGTYYLRARYYDPALGRFLTEDSYHGKDSDPLSLNLYTYCGNNPVNGIDPTGHFMTPLDDPLFGMSPENKLLFWTEAAKRNEDNILLKNYCIFSAIGPYWQVKYKLAKHMFAAPLASSGDISYEDASMVYDFAMGYLGGEILRGAAASSSLLLKGTASTIGKGPFKAGEMFESSFKAKSGVEIGGLADVEVKGTTLTLKNVTVYSNQGDIPNAVGAKDIFQWQKQVSQMAKEQGFATLKIQGVRVPGSTSANPGKVVDYTIDLTKLK